MAPAGIPWSVPLAVIGGGYPYNFDALIVPDGMIVVYVGRDTLRPPFYEYLYWPDPQVGSYTIRIRCRDQNGTAVDRVWTLNVYSADDTNRFLFLNSATGSHGGSGTRSSPKLDIGDWYLTSENNSTYQSHQIFYEGNFNIGGVSNVFYEDGVLMEMRSTKPATHVGIGAGATFSGNGACWQGVSGQGVYCGDFTYNDPFTTFGGARNQQFFCSNSYLSRGALFRIAFGGSNQDSGGGSNPSCIMLADSVPAANQSHYAFIGCSTDAMRSQTALKNYNSTDGLMAGWTVRNSVSGAFAHQKGGDIRRWTVRGIQCAENNALESFEHIEWIAFVANMQRADIEISWSNIRIGGNWGRRIVGVAGLADDWQRIDSFRNNWRIGAYHELQGANSGVFTFEDDIIQHAGAATDGIRTSSGFAGTLTKTDLVTGTSGLLDSTTNLRVGGADGSHGCEMVAA